jgi:hypothetical protein
LVPEDDAAAVAARLYAALREFDADGVDEILACLPPARGIVASDRGPSTARGGRTHRSLRLELAPSPSRIARAPAA